MSELDDTLNKLFASGSSTAIPAPNQPTMAVSPDTIAPSLNQDVQTGITRAKSADQSLLGDYIPTQDSLLAQKKEVVQQGADARESISNNIAGETTNYASQTQPIFQRRVDIAQHKAELASMSPFGRFVASLKSKSNNVDWLNAQDEALKGELSTMGDAYQASMNVHGAILKTLDQKEQDATSIIDTGMNANDQKLKTAMQSVNSIQTVIGSELKGLEANDALLRANSVARQDTLGKMTLQDAQTALAHAAKGGGSTVVNGITLSQSELQERVGNWQDFNYNLATRAMALKTQQMGLAEESEHRMVTHMSFDQLDSAIKNGGKLPDGTQLNMTTLAQAYQGAQAVVEANANKAIASQSGTVWRSSLNQIGTTVTQTSQRSQDLMGVVPGEVTQQSQALAIRLKALGDGLVQARANGGEDGGNQYIAKVLPEVQAIQAQLEKTRTAVAAKWAGNNKWLQAGAESYLSNQPLSAEGSAGFMIAMAENNMSPGTKLSPQAAAQFADVKAVVDAYNAKKKAQAFQPGQTKTPKGEYDPELMQAVQQKLQGSYSSRTLAELIQLSPQFARTVVDKDGQPHPASRIRPEDMRAAQVHADEMGLEKAAQAAGFNPNNKGEMDSFRKMMNEGPTGSTYQTYAKSRTAANQKPFDFNAIGDKLSSYQSKAMFQLLDSSPSAQPGFRPSEALVSLFNDGQFQQKAMQYTAGQAQGTVGDWAIHNVASGQFGTQFFNYGQQLGRELQTSDGDLMKKRIATSMQLRNTSPEESALIALHSNPHITAAEASQLMQAVLPIAGKMPGVNMADKIDHVLTRQQFQDPALEKIRKAAAKDWTQRRTDVNKGLAGFIQSLSGGLSSLTDPLDALAGPGPSNVDPNL